MLKLVRGGLLIFGLAGVLFSLVACGSPAASAATATGPASVAPTPGSQPTAPATTPPPATKTPPASVAPSPGGMPARPTVPGAGGTEVDQPPYLDDRSSPEGLMWSFVNALNRHEYARAYSYWSAGAVESRQVPSYEAFKQGYSITSSVDIRLGTIGVEAGAGQRYYYVPAVLTSTMADGSTRSFAGCYQLRLANPGIQGAPPFHPLSIDAAEVRRLGPSDDADAVMAAACASAAGGTALPPAPPPGSLTDIGADNYIDNRSGPVDVLASLYNAVNRQEYVRAYSYWSESAISEGNVPTFAEFERGYADTESVELQTGRVSAGAAAGNRYYDVPVTLKARTTAGEIRSFVGCYTLHLGHPAIQDSPPFEPLSITSATIQPVDNDADTESLIREACPMR